GKTQRHESETPLAPLSHQSSRRGAERTPAMKLGLQFMIHEPSFSSHTEFLCGYPGMIVVGKSNGRLWLFQAIGEDKVLGESPKVLERGPASEPPDNLTARA